MNVLQTIGGFDANFGGTSTCVYDLMMAIDTLKTEHQVDLLAPDTGHMIVSDVDWLKAVPCDYKTPLCLSKNITSYLMRSDYDIYHTNGLWMHVNHISCVTARKKNRPYVITPHGTLYPEALHRGYWKKWPFLKLWHNRDIHNANCIHVTCEQEKKYLRSFGYEGPIAVIANPVSIPDYTEELFSSRSYPEKLTIGYLGRLHPRKKVENILYGLVVSNIPNAEVVIIGAGNKDYEHFLRSEVLRLGLENNVRFKGFVTGRKKFEMLASFSALLVPSDFENFGMIIPEALIVGTPVFASCGTPWQSLISEHCGWWADNSVESIARFISELNSIDNTQLKEMGTKGRAYIYREFLPEKIAGQMMQLYHWILKEMPQPQFVHI